MNSQKPNGWGDWNSSSKLRGGPPLRSTVEIAQELNISVMELANKLRAHDGPKPARVVAGRNAKNLYDPAVVRKWWRSINDVS